jgi:hypothetical protein
MKEEGEPLRARATESEVARTPSHLRDQGLGRGELGRAAHVFLGLLGRQLRARVPLRRPQRRVAAVGGSGRRAVGQRQVAELRAGALGAARAPAEQHFGFARHHRGGQPAPPRKVALCLGVRRRVRQPRREHRPAAAAAAAAAAASHVAAAVGRQGLRGSGSNLRGSPGHLGGGLLGGARLCSGRRGLSTAPGPSKDTH